MTQLSQNPNIHSLLVNKEDASLKFPFIKPFQMCNRFDQALISILMVNEFTNAKNNTFHMDSEDRIGKPSRTGVHIIPGSSGDIAMKAIHEIELKSRIG